ncbi:Probable RNA-directed DNA polymerase from transposon BS [Eumeta japonica]|uniref:Probable RNA-directed DNA polymerase from transposon BS n=1 Tax=Eumeta variegata TaxID=151549 RepID=A0A4C1Y8D6_EUMVA|nr:Probable RNA-directed DNA polymerase from transposon BS [Eumeta japonica]
MIGHGILILVSVHLLSKKELLRSDLEALFALGDAVILFGDFNSKNTNWKCNYSNRNGRKMEDLAKSLHFNIVSAALDEIDTSKLNSIPNDIVSTDDIDNAIGALTNHIRTVVESSSRTVSAKSDRRELPGDVSELTRDKNAALRRAGKYSTWENRSLACATVRRVEEEIRHRVAFPPKNDLDPITHDEVSKHIKGLKIRKAPGRNSISSKALKCFSAPLVALLVAIYNALDNTFSSMRRIRAGVPQGSRLSPVLYSAYVNDIPRPSTGFQLTLFADDTALYLRSSSIGNILPRLQRAIDELTQ